MTSGTCQHVMLALRSGNGHHSRRPRRRLRPGTTRRAGDEVTAADSKVAEILGSLKDAADDAEREKIRRRITDPATEVIGVRMGTVFEIARRAQDVELEVVHGLLDSEYYEMRVAAAAILDFRARAAAGDHEAIFDVMLSRIDRFDSWDLIDRAAPRVMGAYLLDKPREVLFDLAKSSKPMRRRAAITAAFWIIRSGDLDDPIRLCEMLAADDAHFVQTNVGVALREIGRIDRARLVTFLDERGADLSAHALRTARSALRDAG